MVKQKELDTVFDYSSVFQYGPADIPMKSYRRSFYKSAYTYHAISISEEESEKSTKETLPSVILRNVITFVLYAVTILLFPLSVWVCIKRVHSLERIVLMRLGKLQPIKGPGFAFILPCVDKWTRVDLRPQNFTVSTSQLLTSDGGVIEAQTDIEYRVSDVISYVMKLHQQESTLKDLGLFCLTNIVSEKDQEDMESKREIVSCNVKDELNRSAINWGLEIINVYLHSVKILKAAEPVDAIGALMSALQAATGTSSQHTAAIFPTVPDAVDNSIGREMNKTLHDDGVEEIQEDCIDILRKMADMAIKEGLLTDLTAKFKFDIVGRTTRIVYIVFEKGTISVLENFEQPLNADVELMLSEDNLKDFLSGAVSPLEAYMDGKVMVTGDWSLLRSLAKVFDLFTSK